jgi:hypothetical protein
MRTSFDPVTVAGIALLSGVQQAGATPSYKEGAKGYGQRKRHSVFGLIDNIEVRDDAQHALLFLDADLLGCDLFTRRVDRD